MNTIVSASQLPLGLQAQLSKVITTPIYQYYFNDQIGGYRFFYSPKAGVQNGWTYEKIAFYGLDKSTPNVVPVYQYYNYYRDGGAKYYYTTKGNEGNNWKPDVPLPAFYAYTEAQTFTQPVYQYYADDLKDGGKKYFYSTDPNGARNGWKLDFVAFHVAIAEKLELSVNITKLTIAKPGSEQSSVMTASQSFSVDADKLEGALDFNGMAMLKSGENQPGIFATTDPFSVAIEFAGQGSVFEYFANQTLEFEVEYLAEAFGPNPDVTLGSVTGKLVPDQLIYGSAATTLKIAQIGNLLNSGLYRITAALIIRDRQHYPLVLLFSQASTPGSIIQIYR
jgi:hypothetical protein